MSENNNIYNIEGEDENYLFGKNKEVPFITPPSYFDSLAERIINKIEALEELNEFTVLASINKQQSFAVPENYFGKADNEIEYQTELAAFTVLSKIPKPALRPLSAEYLDGLKEKITSKVEIADEIKEYATLYALDKQNNFAVSADYFDSVADRIKDRIHTKPQSQISIIEQLMLVFTRPKLRLAFSIVVIAGIAGVFYFNNKTTTLPDGDCKTLACLEKREMLNEHTIREMDDDNLIDMVDVDKLDKQIGSTKDSTAVKEIKK